MGIRCHLAMAAALSLSLGVSVVLGLDEQQQAAHRAAQTALKAAQADLDAARSSAGTAGNPAKGARLRLTQTRLDSARQRLEQAAGVLGQLPAEDQAVKETRLAHEQATQAAAEIQAIINPPASSESGAAAKKDEAKSGSEAKADAGKPASAAAAPKLDYKQEELLRNARFNLREVAGGVEKAGSVVSALDAPDNKVVHGQVVSALATLEQAFTKLKHANDALAQLPASHPQVSPVVKAAAEAGEKLGAYQSRLQAQEKALGQLAGVGNYPRFDQDFTLLQELSRRYGDFAAVSQQPELLAQIIREDTQVMQEIQRIARTYLPLVEQKTDAGQRMEKLFNHFQSQRGGFATQLMEYRKTLPDAFQKDVDQVQKLVQQAVQEKKPAFFAPEGGVEQHLQFAQQKLLVMEAFGEEAAAPFKARMQQVRDQAKAQAKSLEEQIIAGNVLPNDNYKGADRDAIIAMAKEGWSHQQKDAKILKAVIPSESWTHDTRWRWTRDAFVKVDVSRIQVQLVIQHDGQLAVIQPVNIHKDHLQNDRLTGHPLREGSETPPPQAFLLLSKVK